MRLSSGTPLHNVGFALALALVGALAWQGKRTQEALLASNEGVVRSLELIAAIDRTLSSLQDVESGSRGYLLTGDRRFLAPYESGRRAVVAHRRQLGELLVQRAPSNTLWLGELDRNITLRIDIAEANIARRERAGMATASRSSDLIGGMRAMEALRAQLGDLRADELARLATERSQVKSHVERGRLQALSGAIVIALLLAWTLIAINRNLRERRQLAERAQTGESRQSALLRAVPDSLYELSRSGEPVPLSGGADALAALPAGLFDSMRRRIGQSGDLAVHGFDWQEPGGREYEVRLARTDGDTHLAMVRDVTDANRTRQRLRDQRAFLRNVVDADENLIFVRDPGGRFQLCNVAFADVLGLRPDQIEGLRSSELPDGDLLAPLLEGDTVLLQHLPELRRNQINIVDASGRERWLQLLKRPLRSSDGELQVLTVAVDVSERRQIERMKGEFISTVSHELRTPLTAIRGALGMLSMGMAGDLPEASRSLVEVAANNSERLVRLINDILDIEKLESGRLPLQVQSLSLRTLLRHAIEQNGPYAQDFDVRLALRDGPDARIEVDPDRFAQVMANLLSNAIKHSPGEGTVTVSTRILGHRIEASVEDQGVGIPEAFRARVFERFAQADSSDVRRRGGTGLGLAITRSLVEQMRGSIGFDTETDHGTRFFVAFPVAGDVDEAAGTDARRCILVVESDPVAAGHLAEVLKLEGFDVDVAGGDDAARARLDNAQAGRFDAVALGLDPRDGGGLALLHWLRGHPAHRDVPIVVLGTRPAGDASEPLRGGAIGVVDWLQPPFDAQRLLTAVRAGLPGPAPAGDILHVASDPELCRRLAGLMDTQDITVHAATSIAEARGQLARRAYRLAIVDLVLPDGDGSELLTELAATQPPTPAIICSALESPGRDSAIVLKRLVTSRHGGRELAAQIADYLRHWPARPVHPQGDATA
ncbi:MAG: ATP-binding protein [Pseudomonas sp.]|nr:ATP-binding protein [Pseudomonas sp.]